MTEQLSPPVARSPPVVPAESVPLTVSDRTVRVDRCVELLADRRRRFCLYHLLQADRPLAIHDLAALVEASVTPAESELTEAIPDEAVLRLAHTHLPKLRDTGLVAVSDGYVELPSNPPIPIRQWLTATFAGEIDSTGEERRVGHRFPVEASHVDGIR